MIRPTTMPATFGDLAPPPGTVAYRVLTMPTVKVPLLDAALAVVGKSDDIEVLERKSQMFGMPAVADPDGWTKLLLKMTVGDSRFLAEYLKESRHSWTWNLSNPLE